MTLWSMKVLQSVFVSPALLLFCIQRFKVAERGFDEVMMGNAHGGFDGGFQPPCVKATGGAEGGDEIPVGEVAEVEGGEGLVVTGEASHGIQSEGPEQFQAGGGEIGEGVAEGGVFPVDDGGEVSG